MLYEVATNPHFKGLWGNVAQTDSNAFNISFLGITYLLTYLLNYLLTYLLTYLRNQFGFIITINMLNF